MYRVEPVQKQRSKKYVVMHNDNIICTCDSELDALAIGGLLNQATPMQKLNARYEMQKMMEAKK